MERLLAWTFVLLTLGVLGYMVKQAVNGKRPFLSVRNVFLCGVILFQLTSAAIAYFTQRYGELPIGDPVGSGLRYVFIITTFIILFTVVYESGWLTFNIPNRLQPKLPNPGGGALVILSIACLIMAAVLRLLLAGIPLLGIFAENFSSAMAAMAAGTAAWAWASRPRNAALLAFLLLIAMGAAAITLFETFGRRGLVGVMVACLWGAYHGGFRYISFKKNAIPLGIIAAGGLMFVAAYTSVRGEEGKGKGFAETARRLAEADIAAGLVDLLAGQDAAGNSLWVLENRPEPFPYDPLASLVYFSVHPIPRIIWEGKPIGLGSMMVPQSHIQGRGEEFSFGPGLVGHLMNDNPWIALPLYAVLLAAWIRIMDDMLRRFEGYLYIVLPLGIELGEILGLARGELGFFLFRAVTGMIAGYVGMMIVTRILRAMGFSFQGANTPAEAPEYAEAIEAYASEPE